MNPRRALTILLACLVLACSAPVLAADRSASIAFATDSIVIPVPDGFADPSVTPPVLRDVIEHGLPATNRFMALLMPQDFLARRAAGENVHMSRYFLVQTYRQAELAGISPAEFDSVKAMFRTQGAAVMKAAASEVEAGFDRTSKALGKVTGDASISVKASNDGVLGVFDERPNSISMASMSTVSTDDKSGPHQFRQVTAMAIVRVHGKPLGVSVYSDYTSQDDVDWAEQSIRDWLTRLDALNEPSAGR